MPTGPERRFEAWAKDAASPNLILRLVAYIAMALSALGALLGLAVVFLALPVLGASLIVRGNTGAGIAAIVGGVLVAVWLWMMRS